MGSGPSKGSVSRTAPQPPPGGGPKRPGPPAPLEFWVLYQEKLVDRVWGKMPRGIKLRNAFDMLSLRDQVGRGQGSGLRDQVGRG